LNAELNVFQREMDKFFRDLETQEAERQRADDMAYRRETEEWMNEDMDTAMAIKEYYMTVIGSNDEKLAFFDLVYGSYEDDEYGWDMKEQLDWQIQYTYDQLVSFQDQMQEIDTYISDLNFDRFLVEQQWQQEDEWMYNDILWRAEAQESDYLYELEEIEEAIGESYELEGEELTEWIAGYGEVAYNEYNNRRGDLNEWLEEVEGEVEHFTEVAEEFADQRADEAEARMVAAHQEELDRAAAERDNDEKRIKRETENANTAIRTLEADYDSMIEHEGQLNDDIENAETQEDFLRIDSEMQDLMEAMIDNQNELSNLYSLLDQLDHDQELINDEKAQEAIERILLEDELWLQEYERVQEEMAQFQEDYEEKKYEYEGRRDDIEYMSEGPAKDEAERLLEIMR